MKRKRNVEDLLPTEVWTHIISFVPCWESCNWLSLQASCKKLKAISGQLTCPNPDCSPEFLMMTYLRTSDPTILAHWWHHAKGNPNHALGVFCVEACLSSNIQFATLVIESISSHFESNQTRPFFRTLLVRSPKRGRSDVIELLLSQKRARATLAVFKEACKLYEKSGDSSCINVLFGEKGNIVRNLWEYLESKSMTQTMEYMLYHTGYGTHDYVKRAFKFGIQSNKKALSECAVKHKLHPGQVSQSQLFTIAEKGWANVLHAILKNGQIVLDPAHVQNAFEWACKQGSGNCMVTFLDDIPNMIDVNRGRPNQIFRSTLMLSRSNPSATLLLENAWHQLQFRQPGPEEVDQDLIYVAAKMSHWSVFYRLLEREDLDITVNINRVSAIILDKANHCNTYQAHEAMDALCRVIEIAKDQTKQFTPSLVYDMIRFASNCSHETFKNSVLHNDYIVQCIT